MTVRLSGKQSNTNDIQKTQSIQIFPALHFFGLGIWCLTPLSTIVLVE